MFSGDAFAPEQAVYFSLRIQRGEQSVKCCYRGILMLVVRAFEGKSPAFYCFSHTVMPFHSCWQAGEKIQSYSHEQVNTVAVSSEPVRKYTAYTEKRRLPKGTTPVFRS